MTTQPTLSGAESGRVRPLRPVAGGIWFVKDDKLENVPCALRVVPERAAVAYSDLARQYLRGRGDGEITGAALGRWTGLLRLQHALVSADSVPGKVRPLFPMPDLCDAKGKVNPLMMGQLALLDLADAQFDRLVEEYDLLMATQCPASITHEQWEKIVSEGKAGSALKELVSRHGSSALIQVLHGMGDAGWGE